MLTLPTPTRRVKRLGAVAAVLVAYVALVAASFPGPAPFAGKPWAAHVDPLPSPVTIRDGWLYRDGEKLLINAVGWDPARPGELPWNRGRSVELTGADFRDIKAAGFNSIRTWEVLTDDELAAADSAGLMVIQGIWIDSRGPFSDPEFRRAARAKIAHAVRRTSGWRPIVMYLLMNEPHPDAVLRDGLTSSREFLAELRDAARAAGARVPLAFANWPGGEVLDDPEMDLVAVNLYPFRPRTLVDTIGYAGMVQLWKQEQARERPLIVSEYGVSVSPYVSGADGPGGVSEAEQATLLPQLADAVLRSGAAGAAAFMWHDGWWKNDNSAADEQTHDPHDGEEWFGLHAFEHVDESVGRPRPALAAMQAWNRAVLTAPTDGLVATRVVPIEIHTEGQDLVLNVSIDDGAPGFVPLRRAGAWLRGTVALPADESRIHKLRFVMTSRGEVIAERDRWVASPAVVPVLHLRTEAVGDKQFLVAEVQNRDGERLGGVEVRVAVVEASRRFDQRFQGRTGPDGQVRFATRVPNDPVVLTAVAAIMSADVAAPVSLARTYLAGKHQEMSLSGR